MPLTLLRLVCSHIREYARDRGANGKADMAAEIKAVVAATNMSFGTVLVDGDDGIIEQQDGFLTPPKSSKLLVKFIHF